MTNIAVLLTVHNRKTKTINCLENLFQQEIPSDCNLDAYLTDDGCTDGTPEEVRERYPQVNIIKGDGTLFWNRGMWTAWDYASKEKDYDFYLWLNDDTYLYPYCIKSLLKSSNECGDIAVVVASICNSDGSKVTYGGHRLSDGKLAIPNGKLQECQTMNGNCVLIPRSVYKKCGNLDWTFIHAIGDLDYGYTARRNGFKVYSSKEYLGICENNPQLPAWARPEVPFIKRIKNLYSPIGYAQPGPFFHYDLKNFGMLQAIKHYVTIHIRVCFPGLWARK